jgi:hypothetical protein
VTGPSPIKRVISLLEKMRAELVAEADKEAEMYDKMVCWCETNEKEKKKAIADAEALDKELSAEIEERAAKFGETATEIERLKEQISEDTASLKTGTSIRESEASTFRATNKDLVQSITNVKNAIQILGKHHKGASSFVQLDAPLLASMRQVLKDLASRCKYSKPASLRGVTHSVVHLSSPSTQIRLLSVTPCSVPSGPAMMMPRALCHSRSPRGCWHAVQQHSQSYCRLVQLQVVDPIIHNLERSLAS